MGFLIEVFWAMLMAGVPIAVFTVALVWWSLQRGYFKASLDTRELRREMISMKRSNKKDRADNPVSQHPLQKKWAKFGGGFYGIVAFFTYVVVEVREIISMIMNVGGFFDFLKRLDIGVIVSALVNALVNFVTAMIWPAYWTQQIDSDLVWVWFVVAYGGYWLGLRLAQAAFKHYKTIET